MEQTLKRQYSVHRRQSNRDDQNSNGNRGNPGLGLTDFIYITAGDH